MDPIASLQGDFLVWILRGYALQDDDGAGALRGAPRRGGGEQRSANQGDSSPTLKGVFYIETLQFRPRMGLFCAQNRFIMEQIGLFSHLARVLLIKGREKKEPVQA